MQLTSQNELPCLCVNHSGYISSMLVTSIIYIPTHQDYISQTFVYTYTSIQICRCCKWDHLSIHSIHVFQVRWVLIIHMDCMCNFLGGKFYNVVKHHNVKLISAYGAFENTKVKGGQQLRGQSNTYRTNQTLICILTLSLPHRLISIPADPRMHRGPAPIAPLLQ